MGRGLGLIVSNDAGNQYGSIVIVVALTARQPRRRYPFHVRVPTTAGGDLQRDSIVMCDHMMTVSKDRLLGRIGALPPGLMAQVDGALHVALSLS